MSSASRQAHPAEDVAIDYTVTGEGPAILLAHGITESRASWDPLVGPLADAGYRVICVDLRGHGASSKTPPYDLTTMANDIGAVLREEGVDDALLIGHSLGGAVVSAYAAAGPCRGVINVDQSLALADFKTAVLQLEPMLKGDEVTFQQAITAMFDMMAGALTGAERDRIEANRKGDQSVVLGVWDLLFTAPVEELDAVVDAVAANVSVPYLSLHGIDPGPDYDGWLTSRLATATVEVWPDLGHYPHLVEPERFVERVTSFDPTR